MKNQRKTIILAEPHGICNGVKLALDAVERLLESPERPVRVLHEIVHNNFLVADLKRRGVEFVDSLDDVPDGATLLFSAHGVSRAVEQLARRRHLRVEDATCPIVRNLHRRAENARDVLIVIGHARHPEVIGTLGCSNARETYVVADAADVERLPKFTPEREITLLVQTTLDTGEVENLKSLLRGRYPQLSPEDGAGVCYATAERQRAIRALAEKCDCVIVIGSPHSSNSCRLREAAEAAGARAFLIDGPDDLPVEELKDAATIGVGAGASAPEKLVHLVLEKLAAL